jgi:hypothetical protein
MDRLRIGLMAAVSVAIPVVGLSSLDIRVRWYLSIALIVVLLMLIGLQKNRRLGGVLVDDRRKLSLSRLQLVGWTVLIISAYSTAALWNTARGAQDPMSIAIPMEVWALMGISVISFVGSKIVKSSKRETGKLVENDSTTEARAMDIFKDEEKGTGNTVDLGKVQLFLFTLVVFAAYAVGLDKLLAVHEAKKALIVDFPALSEGMLALLGLSHTGYLANKAVPSNADQRSATPSATPKKEEE